MTSKSASKLISFGTRFRYTHADSRPEWEVISKRGAETWNCEVVSDEWKGTKKVFGSEEIRAALRQAEFWQTSRKNAEDFWASRKLGETVHYHNGFGQWVRGVVVMDKGEKKMRPVALLGNWASYDLPRHALDGSVRECHTAKMIRTGETMQPHDSNMFESPSFSNRKGDDPTTMEPLSLKVPPMTPEQERLAKLERTRLALIERLQGAWNGPQEYTAEHLEGVLSDARRMLEEG